MATISQAGLEDVSELNRLVNAAYRGESSTAGWTHEADLLEGIRIDEEQLASIINRKDTFLLKYTEDKNIAGCVLLEKQGEELYLGMLTVNPLLQAKGIGKALLSSAENKARETGCKKIKMTVITLRTELISWYKRHGYSDTGAREPFPVQDSKWGTPRLPLQFMVMEKELR